MSGLVLVTGATGKTGKSLVSLLHDAGVAYRTATRGSGFDWTDPATWDAAVEGVSSVYLVAPPAVDDPYSKIIAFAEAAKVRGVRRFVFLGMAGLPAGSFAHGLVHQWLKDNSDDWAVLGPSAFMQNFIEGSHLATIQSEDTFYSNTGTGRVPFINADDIACAAFAALTSETPPNREFTLTGSEAISYDQVAEEISRACGRRITHTHISTDELVQRFIKRRLPEMTARFLAAGYETIAAGMQEKISGDFGALTGKTPVRYREFAEASAEVWKRSA